MSDTTQEATQTVTIQRPDGGTVDVEGRIVAPGLAITPATDDNRYSITHIPSGLAFIPSRCTEHIEAAAQMAAGTGIDWTRDKDTLVADPAVRESAKNIVNAVGYCYGRCDKAEGPSWSVRCNTCHWEWEDEFDEGPLDAKEAKRLARNHECESEIELSPPDDSNEWHPEWLVNDDGTVGTVRRSPVARESAETPA